MFEPFSVAWNPEVTTKMDLNLNNVDPGVEVKRRFEEQENGDGKFNVFVRNLTVHLQSS